MDLIFFKVEASATKPCSGLHGDFAGAINAEIRPSPSLSPRPLLRRRLTPSPLPAAAMGKPHAVCIPYPAQGHITPMMQLAKLLHSKGFHITFVNTEYNHERSIRSRGPDAVKSLKDFGFESIPDGLPPSDPDRTQDIPALCDSITKNFHAPFLRLLEKLNESAAHGSRPPVTCIVSDGAMSFTHKAARMLGLPIVLLWTTSACGFWAYFHYLDLIERGYTPLKGTRRGSLPYISTFYISTSFLCRSRVSFLLQYRHNHDRSHSPEVPVRRKLPVFYMKLLRSRLLFSFRSARCMTL